MPASAGQRAAVSRGGHGKRHGGRELPFICAAARREDCFAAAGLAIQNMLGLVCDPIAGLVEAPCQARNAAGASNALVSAELVLAGVPEVIPFDEVVEAMRQVGSARRKACGKPLWVV